MQRIYARLIRDIFRPRLNDKLELIAELHFAKDSHLPEGHIVREKSTGTYFMHRGGGILIALPQDAVIGSLHDAGLIPGESTDAKVKRELAELMKSWRQKAHLNTTEAGARLGMSPRTVEWVEQSRGFRYPNLLVLALLQSVKG